MMDYDVDEILKRVQNKTDYSEIYLEKNKSTEISFLNDKINYAKEEDVTGLGLRVINNHKQGFAYTTNPEKIDEVIEKAISNSKLNSPDENISLIEKPDSYEKIKGLYDKSLENVDLTDALDTCESIINMVKDNKCNPTSGEYEVVISTKVIANSNDVYAEESSTYVASSVSVNVDDNGIPSSAYDYDLSHENNLNLGRIVNNSTSLALNSRNPQSTHTRDSCVVLDYFAAVGLLNTFFSALSSENTQRGKSILKDKLNQVVASDKFSLYDDGTIPKATNSSMFDDEGSPSQKTELIKNGEIKNFIYDTYHANKDERDVQTTANATRSGYNSVPSIGFSNIKLEFDDITPISDINEGVLVTHVMGAHTANPVTGDFSVEAMNAFEIKNGEISTPIKKAMISGNVFDIMKDVTAVTTDVRQIGSCITPKLLANKLRVIG